MGPVRAQFWLPSAPLASWTRRNRRKTDRAFGIGCIPRLKMAIFLSYGRTSPVSLSRTHDNRTPYAVADAGDWRTPRRPGNKCARPSPGRVRQPASAHRPIRRRCGRCRDEANIVPELVEHEERMIADAGIVAVPDAVLLFAVSRTDARSHVVLEPASNSVDLDCNTSAKAEWK